MALAIDSGWGRTLWRAAHLALNIRVLQNKKPTAVRTCLLQAPKYGVSPAQIHAAEFVDGGHHFCPVALLHWRWLLL